MTLSAGKRFLGALLSVTVFFCWGAGADDAQDVLARYERRVDTSIDRALRYLVTQQGKDGSFKSGFKGNVGVTSLCVMAFLSKGYTPGTGPYGQNINRGIDHILKHADPGSGMLRSPRGGSSHGGMYGHCIATLLLSEVSGMVDAKRQEQIDKFLPKAVALILKAQRVKKAGRHEGGWRYNPSSSDSDISCTGWAIMALRSARGNGAAVPGESIEKAVEYVLKCRHESGGFGYQPGGGAGLARTGTALLCLELAGRHATPPTRGAGDWVLQRLPDRFAGDGFFYYGLYYCSQGMFQLGGKYWKGWAGHMFEMMLKHQNPKDGSWPKGRANEARAGQAYATAMGVLAMTVAYRQLPIYQR
jgi:prenyltransferase beta subunit